MITKMKNYAFYLRGFFPKKLPVGKTELETYCDQLFSTYNIPKNNSHKHAFCTMVMNLGPTVFYKAPFYFALAMRKAQANQVAYDMLMVLREEEKKLLEKEKEEAKKNQNGQSIQDNKIQVPASQVVQ